MGDRVVTETAEARGGTRMELEEVVVQFESVKETSALSLRKHVL